MNTALPVERAGRASAPSVMPPASGAWRAALDRVPAQGLKITAQAAEYAAKKLAARGTPNAAVRLGIRGGGCSGFSYVVEFEDGEPRERDYAYEVRAESGELVRFVLDKKSFIYLAGSIFDYERTLMFQGFKFRNPNEATSCGCGHSFTVR